MTSVEAKARKSEARDSKRATKAVESKEHLEAQLQKAKNSISKIDAQIGKIGTSEDCDERFAAAVAKRLNAENRIKRLSDKLKEASTKIEQLKRDRQKNHNQNIRRRIAAKIISR